ncbi:TRAP transporter small permease [Thalassolituus sp. C2-1]|jgi:C4-dicarboxylate transporter DctQ subunit|uniref:TRAP transporter small permease n=1 Tax=Venatorbacter sp. C2-1 TaxID=2597518 RepID=UPI001193814B|nr:TRAP transporter small permease [Thalassolituus sp. C2-1]TVV46001.1 TRAP transporter small permease [Thalassolituus sp. C2-1]
MKKWLSTLHRIEDAVLVLLLLAMIILAGVDILARTLFGGGVVWVQPLLRVMVLWLGLLGALLATRSREHIAIDLINRLAGPQTKRWLAVLTSAFAAFICLVVAWNAQAFVRFAFEFGDIAFGRVPAWPLQLVIPLSFALMGLRFSLQAVQELLGQTREAEA